MSTFLSVHLYIHDYTVFPSIYIYIVCVHTHHAHKNTVMPVTYE